MASQPPVRFLGSSNQYGSDKAVTAAALTAINQCLAPFSGGAVPGSPLGNLLFVSSFAFLRAAGSGAAGTTPAVIPSTCALMLTSYHTKAGYGRAFYVRQPSLTDAILAALPLTTFKTVDENGAVSRWALDGNLTLEFTAFGAIPDNKTDAFPSFQELENYNAQFPVPSVNPVGFTGRTVNFAGGQFYSSNSWNLHAKWDFVGQGGGFAQAQNTVLNFASNIHGIIVNRANTDGEVVGPANSYRPADGSSIRRLCVMSNGGSDSTKHGIFMRGRALLEDVQVANFPGNNVNIIGSAASDATTGVNVLAGNTRGWQMNRVTVTGSGKHGFYVSGTDAGGGSATACEVTSAGAGGIIDLATLGNSWVGGGVVLSNKNLLGAVAYNGVNFALIDNTPVIGASTIPGTNNTVWYYMNVITNGVTPFPAWSNTTNYTVSCSIYSPNSVFFNPTCPQTVALGGVPCYVLQPTQITAGVQAAGVCSQTIYSTVLSLATPRSLFYATNVATGTVNGPTVTAIGGQAPYTYSWTVFSSTSPNLTLQTANTATAVIAFSNFTANENETIRLVATVTDANGTKISTPPSFFMVSFPVVTSLAVTTTDTTLNINSTNGQSQINAAVANNGTAPYQYNWVVTGGTGSYSKITIISGANTAQPTVAYTNFGASETATAVLTVTVTDATQKTTTGTCNVIVRAGSALVATTSNQTVTASNDSGSVTVPVTASGGTAPYKYAWTVQSANGTVSLSNATTANATLSYSNVTNGTASANLQCVVTDSAGTTYTTSCTVSITGPKSPLTASASNTTYNTGSSSSGSAVANAVTVSGGTAPYKYAWTIKSTSGISASINNGANTNQPTVSFSSAANGANYVYLQVVVTDANNASVTATSTLEVDYAAAQAQNRVKIGSAGAAANYFANSGDPAYNNSTQTYSVSGASGNKNPAYGAQATGGSGNYSFTWTYSGSNGSGNVTVNQGSATSSNGQAFVGISYSGFSLNASGQFFVTVQVTDNVTGYTDSATVALTFQRTS